MPFPIPSQLPCSHCGAVAYPTDHAIRASQGGAPIANVQYRCGTCRRHITFSPQSGRVLN